MLTKTPLVALLSIALVSLSACSAAGDGKTTQKKPTTEGAQAAPKAKATPTKKEPAKAPAETAKAGAAKFAEAPYKIRFVSKPATKDQASATTIEITPLAGYKMNKDFPTSLKVDNAAGAKTPKTDFATGDAEITEERVGFRVDFTPNQAGTLAMTGTTNFSVCNERTCKLFRGEKLAWEVSVK